MKTIADIGRHTKPKTKQPGCVFQPRQKPIAAFVATLRIPVRPPEARQDRKTDTELRQSMSEPEETSQSAENGNCLFGVDFKIDDEAPALPVFRDNVKSEQATVVKTIGARMREARELCNMSQSAAAKRLGYSNPSKLSKVEGATDTNSAPLWLIVRASKLYDVSIDFLFGASDDWETGLQRPVQTWLIGEWEKARIRDMKAIEKLHGRVAAVSTLLPTIAAESERTAEAIESFAAINPGFDDMRGGARLVAAAENLSLANVQVAHLPMPPTVKPPSLPVIAEPPPVVDTLASNAGSGRKPQAITVAATEVGQDLKDRRIAHIVTGGLSAT